MRKQTTAVIPGRCEASNPESRDSGPGPSDHPGMTEPVVSRHFAPPRSQRTRTHQTRDHAPAARCARGLHLSLAPNKGVGNAGCLMHPRYRVQIVLVERTRVTTSTPERPAFPHAMVLTAYVALSPVTGLFCHRHQRICFCLSPVGPTQLRELDTSFGA